MTTAQGAVGSTVELKTSGQLAWITINRPEAMNALSAHVLRDLRSVFEKANTDHSVRVILITGSGEKAFVAGADIKEINGLSAGSAVECAREGQRIFSLLENASKPVIAVVNGFALGGGLELALACDMIWASEKAKFGLPECTLGIMPGFGGSVRLPRRIGTAAALEVMMTGGFYSAQEAQQLGLCARVWPADKLITEATQLAEVMASRAPLALAAIKKSVRRGDSQSVDAALEIEAHAFGDLFNTKDQKEGTSAFIEKRKPSFKAE